jgi:hypothetical protein
MAYVPLGLQTLTTAVANNGTLTFPYPVGLVQADFTGDFALERGSVAINSNEVYEEFDEEVLFTYGASLVTVQNLSGVAWVAGSLIAAVGSRLTEAASSGGGGGGSDGIDDGDYGDFAVEDDIATIDRTERTLAEVLGVTAGGVVGTATANAVVETPGTWWHQGVGGAEGKTDAEAQALIIPINTLTARATGATDSVVPDTDCKVIVAAFATDANDWIVLPTPTPGREIRGYSAVAHEIRTVASSNVKINNVDGDGTQEAAIPATTFWVANCTSATTWILRAWNNLAAPITAIIPD